jgi:hypothetical protein
MAGWPGRSQSRRSRTARNGRRAACRRQRAITTGIEAAISGARSAIFRSAPSGVSRLGIEDDIWHLKSIPKRGASAHLQLESFRGS